MWWDYECNPLLENDPIDPYPQTTKKLKTQNMSTGAADVGLDELQTRLVTFTQQLESIHELLQSDPQNEEFLGIAQDLVEVIRLTKEMV